MDSSPRIGIVGSAGSYGRWLRAWFARAMELHVVGSDPADPDSLAPEALIARSDVIVFSAPVRHSAALIREYARIAAGRERGQLWMDLTSIKVAPVAAMLESQAEVVGLHPLTAPPKAPSLRGRALVVCEARLQSWRPWLERFLHALQANTVRITPDDHDRRMAVVQNMVHALHLAQANAIASVCDGAIDVQGLLDCRTVGFEADVATLTRMLAGNAQLYADILLGNPHAPAALRALVEHLQSIQHLVEAGDDASLVAGPFSRARHWFGAEAVAQGNYSFERIGYLLADLTDTRALSVHLPEDRPGSLRRLLAIFERQAINLDSVHSSRTPEGQVHFLFGFARETTAAQREAVCREIEGSGVGRVLG